MQRVYLLENDMGISNDIKVLLNAIDCECEFFADYRLFFDGVKKQVPDLIIIDCNVNLMSALEIIKYLKTKSQTNNSLIVLIGDEKNCILGLDNGADEYIKTPIFFPEFKSRINALLRRNKIGDIYHFDNYVIYKNSKTLFLNEQNIALTVKEFDLLIYFITHEKKIVTREELIRRFWRSCAKNTRSLDMHIKALRRKIFNSSNYKLETILKVGYRLCKIDVAN